MVFLQATSGTLGAGTGLTAPFGVAIDSANVYWVSSAGGGAAVQASSVTAGGATTLGTATGGFLPKGMAVNSSSIYFVAQLSGGGGGLFELPIAGATPTEIWTGDATSAPVDVAVDATNVYWTDQGDGAVYATPLGGGTVTTLASKTTTSGLVGPARLAVDSKNVYFSDPKGMGLYEVPTGGGTVKTLVPTSAALAMLGVAADDYDGNVYFSSPTEILSIPK
jgi:sugar lactone lactonase YvrE